MQLLFVAKIRCKISSCSVTSLVVADREDSLCLTIASNVVADDVLFLE